ncbi:ssDNA-binding protein [uncultured Sulfitobacter sp.]|uniref:ssDNA-binding protein n=1 Tax=uncultured Sulfitobacter sp. TaxID=191468 RepID=UPI0030D73078|tara:strand:+ start:752 stop:1303 length:552 start_codon:yes stop_codon:yes gene_type:complete
MADTTQAKVHVRRAMLAYPELHEPGTRDDEGRIKPNKVSLVIDLDDAYYPQMAAMLDKAVAEASEAEFGDPEVEYDKVPVQQGADLKGKDGKPYASMQGKLVIAAENIQMPGLYDGDTHVGPDPEYWYAGAEVYAILQFVARKHNGKKYLNARLSGLKFRAHGTPLEKGASSQAATPDEFMED